MFRKLLLLVGFLFGATAVASEHLVPERSVFADRFLLEYHLEYDTMVVSALEEAFTRDVRVRAIVQPSFQPEYAAGIKDPRGAPGRKIEHRSLAECHRA